MKYITLEEFMKLNIPANKSLEAAEDLVIQVNPYHPAKIMCRVTEEDGKLYFEHAEVKLIHKDIDIRIGYETYIKKYSISADMRKHFKNIDLHTIARIQHDLKKPNEIGVLTKKKIEDWVQYYESLYSRCFMEDQKNGGEKAAFLESIKGWPVRWNADKKSGRIIANGIEMTFTIGDTYVSKKLQLHYSVSDDIETFQRLADNKYIMKKDA